jgi:hypothetical protein
MGLQGLMLRPLAQQQNRRDSRTFRLLPGLSLAPGEKLDRFGTNAGKNPCRGLRPVFWSEGLSRSQRRGDAHRYQARDEAPAGAMTPSPRRPWESWEFVIV